MVRLSRLCVGVLGLFVMMMLAVPAAAQTGGLRGKVTDTAGKPVEGVVSTGGGKLLGVRFGIIPEVIPVLASQVLYFFESNTRSASIIGIVGAGGIGLYLAEAIRTLELQQTSFIIFMILVTVALIDYVSGRLRFAVIGRRGVVA